MGSSMASMLLGRPQQFVQFWFHFRIQYGYSGQIYFVTVSKICSNNQVSDISSGEW
jgi:hypothetical protein